MKILILSILGLSTVAPSAQAAQSPVSDPIAAAIAAVPSYRIYQLQQHASQIDGQCTRTGATVCRTIHRFSNDPGAAAREIDQAMHGACDAAGGAYDNAADLVAPVASMVPAPHGPFDAVHTCHNGRRLNTIEVHVDDYGAGVDRQPHDPVTRLLGDRRSRYEAVTSVIGHTSGDVVIRADDNDQIRAARCHKTRYADLREGVMTTAGLLVEMRLRVALVQPDNGPAVWMPVEKLKLPGRTPGCDGKPVAP